MDNAEAQMVIDSNLEQLICMSSGIAKLKLGNCFYEEQLEKHYKNNLNDLEYSWNYVMYKWNTANNNWSSNNIESNKLFTSLSELDDGLQHILNLQPYNWLATILKVKVDNFFQNSIYSSIEQLEILSKKQEELKFQSYYIITYILLSEAHFSVGNEEEVLKYIRKVEEIKQPILVLNKLFKGIILEYQNKLKKEGNYDLISLIENILISI